MTTIKANTCPYCDGPYTLADGGCRNNCERSRLVSTLIQDAIDAEQAMADLRARLGRDTEEL